MSTNYNLYNKPNSQPPRKPSDGFNPFIAAFLALNGIATGRTITSATDMIKNGYDRDTMIVLLMYLLLMIYTAQRAYQIYQKQKNNNNDNQNQR